MFRFSVLFIAISIASPTFASENTLVLDTIADANEGVREIIDLGAAGSSTGDTLIFDQPLLDGHDRKAIGSNGGFCIFLQPDRYQCQWTLTLSEGSITVGGLEVSEGESVLPVIGTTGIYEQYTGVMVSKPIENNMYRQVVTLHKRAE